MFCRSIFALVGFWAYELPPGVFGEDPVTLAYKIEKLLPRHNIKFADFSELDYQRKNAYKMMKIDL